ncbi:MAG: ATP-dependent zinc protease family protein [Hyphomicrobiales bacterium]
MAKRRITKRASRLVVGWREWIALPELGIDAIKVKVDTGARTSALHAFRIKTFDQDGQRRVRFQVHPLQRRKRPSIECEADVIDERRVTSSNGQKELRLVIRTPVEIAGRTWPIELTLTNRDEMSFRMLLGRQAVRGRAVIDPGRSFCAAASVGTAVHRKKS